MPAAMDTLMTFISKGAYPGRREGSEQPPQNTHQDTNTNASSETGYTTPVVDSDGVSSAKMFDDDVLNEFLNPGCFQQQGELLDFIENENQTQYENTNSNSNEYTHTPNVDVKREDVTEEQHPMNHVKQEPLSPQNFQKQGSEKPIKSVTPPTQELKLYEESKKHLMKVKFGLNEDSKYIHHSNIGYCYTRQPTISNSEDPDVTTTLLPQEYQDAYLRNSDSFPYQLKLDNLPTHSRVETQIKLGLTVTPAPSQFLLHVPRDVITKPKFTLAENQLSNEIQPHLLYLDVFVVGAESNSAALTPQQDGQRVRDNKVRSCNVCKRCMRRELKRASRRKAGLVDDSTNWDINVPKRAIIINCKEIVSFPAPRGNSNERKLELLSRIVCYCRHHQETNGFSILMFLKNSDGEIVGKVASTPILIMDRKKSIKNGGNGIDVNENLSLSSSITQSESVANQQVIPNTIRDGIRNSSRGFNNNSYNDSSSDISAATSSATHDKNFSSSNHNSNLDLINMMTSSSSKSATHNSANFLNPSGKGKTGMFSSLFSFDPTNILGDESSRQVKRQKRPWAQSESSTYFETINQQRAPAHNQGPTSLHNNNSISSTSSMTHLSQQNDVNVSIKRDAISPVSSDTLSPHNNMISSAASVFSGTPEQNRVYDQLANMTPPSNTEEFMKGSSNGSNSLSVNDDMGLGMDIGMEIDMQLNTQNSPVIRRIIPAQGPTRGGIEITLLGSNFRAGLNVKFGSNTALATQCWSDSTIVTYLPPASQAGPVVVTIDDPSYNLMNNNSAHQIFTYTDDTDRQLIELALQIVGLKMNGKLEDAKNIAKRIVGTNQIEGSAGGSSGTSNNVQNSANSGVTHMHQQLQLNWMAVASEKIKELSKSSLNHEEILIKFLNMVKIPNSLISSPNWAVCNSEGQTMLHLACFKNYKKLTRFLISNGSKIDYTDKNGFSPLHFAFINGNRQIIETLLKFKANCSNKLENGVLLSKIADSNVLDLIGVERPMSPVSDFEGFDDDEDEDEDDDYEVESTPELGINKEIEELEVDDYQLSYRATSRNMKRRVKKAKVQKRMHYHDHSDFEISSEADNEGDDSDDSSLRYASIEKGTKGDLEGKETNSFGFNLWLAMKEAIKNKMNEISESQGNRARKSKAFKNSKGTANVAGGGSSKDSQPNEGSRSGSEDEDSEPLPSYDDLFPNGTSLRALMNFRSYGSDEDNQDTMSKKLVQPQKQASPAQVQLTIEEQLTLSTDVVTNGDIIHAEDAETDHDVDMLANKLRTSIGSDTKLLFFWLPCMMLLLLIVIGNNLNIIKLEQFRSMEYVLEQVRESVGSFTLGKERFTNLINENINYGRERMENLLNDVNGVVMTAVAGVGR